MSEAAAAPGAGKAARPPLVGYALSTLLVVVLAALLRLGLLALGRALQGALEGGSFGRVALDVATFGGCLAVVVLALRLAAARRLRGRDALPAVAVALGLFALGWNDTLREGGYHDFHGVWTQSPSQSWTDTRRTLPHITYRHDSNGFRGAGFDEIKAPGRLRVALVGDSFIFGLGVEENQTLKARLEEELAKRGLADRVEVVNLGIPGANLATHVRMYALAHEQLGADAVVMGVFEDNDLTTWDVEDEINDLARPSLFSLGVFALGQRPTVVLATSILQIGGTARALSSFEQIASDLAAVRARDGAPPLVILDYFTHNPEVRARFEAMPNTSFIATAVHGEKSPEYHIPGDGHPSVRGNQHFAGLVAEKLLAYPAFAALAQPAPAP
jgi:hypothetical protein